jgi:hypothetical protein
MKKAVLILTLALAAGSTSLASTVQMSARGSSSYHGGIIQDDLIFLRDSLVHYLSNQVKCHSIDINIDVVEGKFLRANEYSIGGTADCSALAKAEISVKIDSGGAGSKLVLSVLTTNQQVLTQTFQAQSHGE